MCLKKKCDFIFFSPFLSTKSNTPASKAGPNSPAQCRCHADEKSSKPLLWRILGFSVRAREPRKELHTLNTLICLFTKGIIQQLWMLRCCGYPQLTPAGMLKGSGEREKNSEKLRTECCIQRDFRWFLWVWVSVGVFWRCGYSNNSKRSHFFLGLIHVHLLIMLSCDPSVLGKAGWVQGY